MPPIHSFIFLTHVLEHFKLILCQTKEKINDKTGLKWLVINIELTKKSLAKRGVGQLIGD